MNLVDRVRGQRARASLVMAVALLAVLWPLTRGVEHDSFPLSNYPMFTSDQPEVTSFVRAVGVRGDGTETVLPPELAGGTVEVIHANRALRRAVREGRGAQMCAEIAARAAGAGDSVATVLIVADRFDVVAALRADEPVPIARDVLAECGVPR